MTSRAQVEESVLANPWGQSSKTHLIEAYYTLSRNICPGFPITLAFSGTSEVTRDNGPIFAPEAIWIGPIATEPTPNSTLSPTLGTPPFLLRLPIVTPLRNVQLRPIITSEWMNIFPK